MTIFKLWTKVPRMQVLLKQSSKYDQRMNRLSCKIFNEFYFPELTSHQLDYTLNEPKNMTFYADVVADMLVVERNMFQPTDIDFRRNYKYYPAHPQYRELTHVLRDYGLYRDEHRDFNEAMKAIAVSRGKVFRERRGPINKKGAKKK